MANQRTRRGKNRRSPSKPSNPGRSGKPRAASMPWTGKRIALTTLKWGAVGGIAAVAVVTATIALIFWVYGRDPKLPNLRTLADYEPEQVTRVAAADGTIVGELYSERRRYIPSDEIPELVVNAFVAAEDADFFQHEGLDYWGMLRAVIVNLRERSKKQGASTITQQVVKTFLLTRDKSFKRKIQEIILARRLENALDKDEILALYLNQIYFGHGRYGIREAAHYYFGKEVKDLDPGEAALIAGLPQGPEILSPKKERNRERAKRRQKYVLEQMVHHGYLDEAEAKKYIDAPIAVVRDPFPEMGTAPEFVDMVRADLIAEHGDDKIHKLGIEVVTSVDREIQRAAKAALEDGLRTFDERKKYGRPVRQVKPDQIDLEVAKLARRLPKGGPKRGESYLAVIREVHAGDAELVVDLGDWVASAIVGGAEDDARYNRPDPETGQRKKLGERFAVGDVIRVLVPKPGQEGDDAAPRHAKRRVLMAPGPQGAVVVMDPRTRRVLAMVGGYDFQAGDFNRAVKAKRQPGSTFKPFVYATAMVNDKATAAKVFLDAPEVYELWKPKNYDKDKHKGEVRLRYALAHSINTVAIRVMNEVGPDKVVKLAHDMGISTDLPAELSLALGSGVVTPLELTNAFTTLAAGGVVAPPRFMLEVAGAERPQPKGEQVLSPEISFIVVDMMTSVVKEGTARRARKLKIPVAGKTGTSNDARDAWFMGITPSYVVGVWVGFDDNHPLGGGEAGGKTALPIFIDLMERIGKGERGGQFDKPDGLTEVEIDKATGLRAPKGAAADTRYTEYFIAGTEPTEFALAAGEVDAAGVIEQEYEGDGASAGGSDYDDYGDSQDSAPYDAYDDYDDGAGDTGATGRDGDRARRTKSRD